MTTDTPEPVIAETEDLRAFFGKRAGTRHDAGLPRPEAELEAARITVTLARNPGYLWASLRSALAGYPALLSQVPATDGPVDALALGTATVHARGGARPCAIRSHRAENERRYSREKRSRPSANSPTWDCCEILPPPPPLAGGRWRQNLCNKILAGLQGICYTA